MLWVLSLLTLGILPAVWVSGYALLGRMSRAGRLPIAPVTAWCLAPALSLPAWSLAMALSAHWGVFYAPVWGAVGWIACMPLVPHVWRQGRIGHRQSLGKQLVLLALLAGCFALYAAFPHDSFFVGRDQATYANQALNIARTGRLALDWPVTIADSGLREVIGRGYQATGLYGAANQLTVQFSPILPIWLAIMYSAFGIVGIQGFNAGVAALSAAVFYGIASRMMSRRAALAATSLLAFNPLQIWISRITLSETLAQYLVLSGLLSILIARRRRPSAAWVLGGMTLGASVFVRIDGFVLAPLGAAFAWFARATSPAESPRITRARNLGVLAMLAALVVGIPFYWLTSAPYLSAQTRKLLPIAAVTALCLILWWTRWGSGVVRRVAAQRGVWLAFGVALALLGIFAYFVRPRWEPFVISSNPSSPLYGLRDFRENSFVNLGVYLTPVVTFIGLFGFWSLLQRAIFPRTRLSLLLLLLATGGYALLYLYNPSISPDHPWGMRRFVPVIIPALVLAFVFVLDRARTVRPLRRFHLPLTLLATASLVTYPNFRTRSSLFLKEYDGAYEFVSSVADAIPKDALLLSAVTPRLFGHLALGRGLDTIRISLKDEERLDAAQAVLDARSSPDEPYYVLTSERNVLRSQKPIKEFRRTFSWLQETTSPPATEVRKATFTFYLFERRGPLERPWKYLTNLGVAPIDGVGEDGFWATEVDSAGKTRWTKGEAWLDIPIKKGWSPRTLDVDIAGMAPSGTWLTIRANGSEIYNAFLDRSPATLSLSLPNKVKRRLRLELVVDTFRPSEMNASSDGRELGVRLRALALR